MPTKVPPSRLDSTKDFSSLVPAAFVKSNNAYIQANASFGVANSAALYANGAFGSSNSASSYANSSFARSNSSFTQANNSSNVFMTIALSDESSSITTGTGKITFRAPFGMTLYQIPRASLSTASTSGNPAVDINKNGVSIFSTTLTIDANEKTSVTAATPAVLSTTSISDDDEITMDIDAAGTGAKGLKVTLYYRRT